MARPLTEPSDACVDTLWRREASMRSRQRSSMHAWHVRSLSQAMHAWDTCGGAGPRCAAGRGAVHARQVQLLSQAMHAWDTLWRREATMRSRQRSSMHARQVQLLSQAMHAWDTLWRRGATMRSRQRSSMHAWHVQSLRQVMHTWKLELDDRASWRASKAFVARVGDAHLLSSALWRMHRRSGTKSAALPRRVGAPCSARGFGACIVRLEMARIAHASCGTYRRSANGIRSGSWRRARALNGFVADFPRGPAAIYRRIMRLVHAHLAHAGSCMHTTEHTQLTEFDDEHGHQRDEREQHSEGGSHPTMSQIDAPPSAAAELASMITARIALATQRSTRAC